MTFSRPAAADDPSWPRASEWLGGSLTGRSSAGLPVLRVIGLPCSVGSISPSRADKTPAAVRAALARLSPYAPDTGTDLAVTLTVEDMGDWPVGDLPLEAAVQEIHRRARGLEQSGAMHAFLGGDNAVTRPVVSGLYGPDLSRVGLVTLDAHHDVRDLADGPRNGTPVRGLIVDGISPTNVIQIGIGQFTNSAPYAAWCDDRGIHSVTASDVHTRGVGAVIDEALERLADVELIHVDFDMDVLDVAFAPACPGARPGGLSPSQLFEAATLLGAHTRVQSVDLVEVDATTDHEGRTVMATAMTLLAFAAGRAS